MKELKNLIAYIWKTAGKDKLTKDEIEDIIIYEKRFLSPASAKKFFKICISHNLISESDGKYTINFPIKDMFIPLEIKIDEKILDDYSEKEKKSLFTEIVEVIKKDKNKSEKEIVKEINKIYKEMKYTYIEIAALLFAIDNDIDVHDYYDKMKKEIVERCGSV